MTRPFFNWTEKLKQPFEGFLSRGTSDFFQTEVTLVSVAPPFQQSNAPSIDCKPPALFSQCLHFCLPELAVTLLKFSTICYLRWVPWEEKYQAMQNVSCVWRVYLARKCGREQDGVREKTVAQSENFLSICVFIFPWKIYPRFNAAPNN